MSSRSIYRSAAPLLASCLLAAAGFAGAAEPATKAAPKAAKAAAKGKAPAVAELIVPDAQPDQVKAAELVYYGVYDCEFKQTVNIVQSPKYSAFVDVTHGKAHWLMRPVLSSTGAIRLEDVRGETLMVQISSKSMLLNVRTAQRLVDDCISPKQRELIEAAKAAKAAELASAKAATEAASAPGAAASSTASTLPATPAPAAAKS